MQGQDRMSTAYSVFYTTAMKRHHKQKRQTVSQHSAVLWFCRLSYFHKLELPNSTTNLQFISLLLKKLFDLPFFTSAELTKALAVNFSAKLQINFYSTKFITVFFTLEMILYIKAPKTSSIFPIYTILMHFFTSRPPNFPFFIKYKHNHDIPSHRHNLGILHGGCHVI